MYCHGECRLRAFLNRNVNVEDGVEFLCSGWFGMGHVKVVECDACVDGVLR